MVAPVPNLSATPFRYQATRDGVPVTDADGNRIVERWRYFVTGTKPPVWLGFDLKDAIRRLREWEARKTHATVRLVDWSGHSKGSPREPYEQNGMTVEPVPRSVVIPEAVFFDKLREVLTDPVKRKRAAEVTGYPLDRLESLPEPQPSPTLDSLLTLFEEKARVTTDWRRKTRQMWIEFCESVKAKTVREITQQAIAEYYDAVVSSNQSPTYAKHRFGVIKRVFNLARMRGVAPNEMRTALDYCAMLQPLKSSGNSPHPMSREDFHALLNAADEKWASILIASLNFCMYAVDIARVEKAECDLARRTLVTDRKKTSVTRVAVVWYRTVQAIKRLPEADHTHVFLSREGRPYDAEGLRTAFRKLRTRAGLSETVKFSDIRDGAYTAAIEGGADLLHAKILAGHETGISDAYLKRNPSMVADACAAIERAYFGTAPDGKIKAEGRSERPSTDAGAASM